MRLRAALLLFTRMGESETTGRSPSDHVLLVPCSRDPLAANPKSAGLVVSTCICTLPSAPVELWSAVLVTNSQPSARSAGKRTSMIDGACTQSVVSSRSAPFGCLPKRAGSTPQSPDTFVAASLWLLRNV